ncbi:MAG: hypothetical protein OHK93_000629 [Ramalina farinacea]|uniref:cAMP-dependent protein kinase regulatory subunit n=1 Tax=Ramalina farinacea TaxID=258253 RepID=A0AA43TNI3_9LECA|nr:hypothetical protein [Ramalina farinacea]
MSGTFSNTNPFGGGGSFNPTGPRQGSLSNVREDEPIDTVSSPTNTSSSGLFPGSAQAQGSGGPPSAFPPQQSDHLMPSDYNMNRRTSVSAESLTPSHHEDSNWKPPLHAKTADQLSRLRASVSQNFLFSHLDDDSSNLVLGALVEKPIPAKDIKVITQGDAGDYFYVVERGTFDIYVNPSGTVEPGPNGMGNKVNSIGPGGSFGELALMYNAPRAATVVSTEANSTLWALDRVTFRRILMDSAYGRRRMYEKFLEEVPLLSELTLYERSKIADALEMQKFPAGATIIQEGAPGDAFFFLETGEAEAFKSDVGGGTEPVKLYKKGDYFGELALLDDKPRAASVVASKNGEVKVATLGKQGFQRLLGPVEAIMRRTDYSVGGK